jgi:hypothetical protein
LLIDFSPSEPRNIYDFIAFVVLLFFGDRMFLRFSFFIGSCFAISILFCFTAFGFFLIYDFSDLKNYPFASVLGLNTEYCAIKVLGLMRFSPFKNEVSGTSFNMSEVLLFSF